MVRIATLNTPHTLPHSPSRASISLIKCPLPMPPNEGLQDISPGWEQKPSERYYYVPLSCMVHYETH